MWDDHDREQPVRPARGIPSENERDQPSRSGKKPRSLKSHHTITLWETKGKGPAKMAWAGNETGSPGELDGEFRYLELDRPVKLPKGTRYLLTMTTKAGDGDHFHDPAAYDGLSPSSTPRSGSFAACFSEMETQNKLLPFPPSPICIRITPHSGFPSDQPFDSKPTPSNKLADEVEKHVPIQVFFDIWDIVDI